MATVSGFAYLKDGCTFEQWEAVFKAHIPKVSRAWEACVRCIIARVA